MMSLKLRKHVIFLVAAASVAIFTVTTTPAQMLSGGCGSLSNAYGPYDARTDHDRLPVVLNAHFTPAIESLIEGTNTATVGGDLDYTLRVFRAMRVAKR